MAVEWFYRDGASEIGPVSGTQIRSLARSGTIVPETPIRKAEDSNWIKAARIKGLFEGVATVQRTSEPESEEEEGPDPLLAFTSRAASSAASAAGSAASAIGGAVSGWITRRNEKKAELAKASDDPQVESALQTVFNPPALPVLLQPTATVPTVVERVVTEIPCPFCQELVKSGAKKCRHCGEILDVTMRAAQPSHVMMAGPTIINNVSTVANATAVVVGGRTTARWNRGVAIILSLFIPGLGQLYKGESLGGFLWFVITLIGYAAFVVPGLVLHICCVIGAGSGDPYQ